MFRVLASACSVLVVIVIVVFAPVPAWAQTPTGTPQPLYVLAIQTDDADDEADGLTQALRSFVRDMPGWSLADTTQSFETLAIALRCPQTPDAACLQRIGDQLGAAHYVWGTLARVQKGQVSVELHLWRRGEAGVVASAAYSDVLKDTNDPRLRAIAKSLFEKLTGTKPTGAIVIHAGASEGDVVVDDVERGSLKAGTARVVVFEGTHTVEIRGPGRHQPLRTVAVTGGAEREVDLTPPPSHELPQTPMAEGSSTSYMKPLLGYSAVAIGASLIVVSVIEGLNWQSDKNASDQDRGNVPNTVHDVCSDPGSAAAQDACDKSRDAKTVSTLGWAFGVAGVAFAVTGLVLLATPSHGAERSAARAPAAHRSIEILPQIGQKVQSIDVRWSF